MELMLKYGSFMMLIETRNRSIRPMCVFAERWA